MRCKDDAAIFTGWSTEKPQMVTVMSNTTKKPYQEVIQIAEYLVSALSPYCERIEVAGSLRRKRQSIGDIEIVALPTRATNLFGEIEPGLPTKLDVFLRDKGVKLLKDGALYKAFSYRGLKVDLFLPASADHWGCVYTIRTGSHEFNMWLMAHQSKVAGVKFHEGRLYNRYSGALIETPEETDVFDALGLDYIEPKLRDDGKWTNV